MDKVINVFVDDERGQQVAVVATPVKMTVPIYIPKANGDYINCELYTYRAYPGFDARYVKPFVYFCNEAFCLFCNDINKANYESLSDYGQQMARVYYNHMKPLHYSRDFETFVIYETSDQTDQDVTYISWKLGKTNRSDSNDDGTKLQFTFKGTTSRARRFVKWMREMFEEIRFRRYVEMVARNMKLMDKVKEFEFQDPPDWIWLDEAHTKRLYGVCVGVNGNNYHYQGESEYETAFYEDDQKSRIYYSPLVFLMNPINQKILIVHELVHAKIGYEHSHDKYFWYLFHHYSGLPKTWDGAYGKEEEDADTAAYDQGGHPYTCNELIEIHKRWLAGGRKGNF